MKLNAPPASVGVPKALLVVALLVAAGAGSVASAVYFELRVAGTPGPSPGPGSVTVADDLGRLVTAPLNASRVVVLAPSVMDIVYRLGLRDRVVGIGCTTSIVGGMANEYSPNQTALWDLSPSMCIPDDPSLDTESVAELQPQLVLASTITSEEDIGTLSSTYHLPVLILAPSGLPGVVGDVELVAELFPSVAPVAANLEATLQQTIYNASSFDSSLSVNNDSIPSVFVTYGFYGGTYYTYGPGTFGQSLVEYAGGSSISSGVPLAYYGLNATVVLADQPAVIFFGTSTNDPYLVAGQTPDVWSSSAPYWSELNGTKIGIDVTLVTEADPTMVLALPTFLHDLHPSLYPAPTVAPG